MMQIYQLRQLASREEIDYVFLMSALKGYSNPRQKISSWLKTGELIRVKKGLYVFGAGVAQRPYAKELLANLIYGPSAISLAYALAHYGLIPEKVTTITSITNTRNKQIQTPVGLFTYQYLSDLRYQQGIQRVSLGDGLFYLMVTPEKALCDYVYFAAKRIKIATMQDLDAFLLEDLRVDESSLMMFSLNAIKESSSVYSNHALTLLKKYLLSRLST